MNKSTNIFAIILLFAALSSLTSCKWGQKREEPKGKNIICLIDFSDAKNANERLMFYMTAIKDNIIPKLGLYDKVTVLPIDRASVTNSSDIFLANLAQKNFEPEMASPMEEEQIIKDNLKKYIDTLTITFEQSFQTALNNRNKTSLGSDIFGALEVAKNKLSSRDENYIFLFSDMMNWTNTLKMEPQDKNFNSNTLESSIAKVPTVDLSKSTVIVLTGEQVDVSADHFNLVKSFWTKYFQSNNAKLYDYNSASLTKLKEIMNLKSE
ncbi:MAG: hypothetical protein LC105_03915 [Chitinophagales bacterium]|nr:hypothetical protein [Chitinophagales bacterium]